MRSATGSHELSKTTGNAGARVGCGNSFLPSFSSIFFFSFDFIDFFIYLLFCGG